MCAGVERPVRREGRAGGEPAARRSRDAAGRAQDIRRAHRQARAPRRAPRHGAHRLERLFPAPPVVLLAKQRASRCALRHGAHGLLSWCPCRRWGCLGRRSCMHACQAPRAAPSAASCRAPLGAGTAVRRRQELGILHATSCSRPQQRLRNTWAENLSGCRRARTSVWETSTRASSTCKKP
jgi:hypothetical protein